MPGGYIRSFLLSQAVCTDTENNRIRLDKRYEEELKAMYIPASYMSVPVNERFAQIVKEKKENEIIAILKVLDPRVIVAAHKLVNDADGNLQSFRYDYEAFDYSIKQELEIR
nr:hypothetical protein [uncultured Treponema sp.]